MQNFFLTNEEYNEHEDKHFMNWKVFQHALTFILNCFILYKTVELAKHVFY